MGISILEIVGADWYVRFRFALLYGTEEEEEE